MPEDDDDDFPRDSKIDSTRSIWSRRINKRRIKKSSTNPLISQIPATSSTTMKMCNSGTSLRAGAEKACDRAVGDTLRQCSMHRANTQALREHRDLWNDISAPALALPRHAVTPRPEPHGKSALAGTLSSLHSPPDHFRRARGYELHGYRELSSVRETYVKLSHAKHAEQRGAREVTEQQKHTGTRPKARAPQTPASSFSPANFPSASGQSLNTSFTSSRASGRSTEPYSKFVARRASRTASGTRSRATVTPPSPRSMASAPRTASAPSSTQAGGKAARRAACERENAMQTRYAPGKAPRDEYARNCADHHPVRRTAIREDERESHAEMVTESDTILFWGLFVTMITFLSAFVVLSITG